MADESKRISLKIDVNSGTIEIDAPVECFDQAIARTRELTDALDLRRPNHALAGGEKKKSPETRSATSREPIVSGREKLRARASKASSSTGRAGRLGSFEPIRDLLTEEQQQALREFVAIKAAADQSDQVMVVLYKGEELLGRQGFNFNEIYTLMWRAGIDPLPKALDVVIQRLMHDQRVERGPDGYFLKFLGRTRVEKELPKAVEHAA